MKALTVDPPQAGTAAHTDIEIVSVNANRRHYEGAAAALAGAERSWLQRLVTRRVPPERRQEALRRQPDDVKVVVEVDPA